MVFRGGTGCTLFLIKLPPILTVIVSISGGTVPAKDIGHRFTPPSSEVRLGQKSRGDTLNSYKPTISRQAGDYSEKNDVVSFAVIGGEQDREKYNAQFVASVISRRFSDMNLPHKAFYEQGSGNFTVVRFYIRGRHAGDFGLADVLNNLRNIAKQYEVSRGYGR